MPFDKILKFENELAEYTGAKYAVMTDCCTHAIELCLRYDDIKKCSFTPFTYLSLPMTMHKLGIEYTYLDDERQTWIGEYRLHGTRIWDSARKLTRNMYRPKMMQCLSFGFGKPLQTGRGGAILLDDDEAYRALLAMRYDGRDLTITPWQDQKEFKVGYHYRPTIEEAVAANSKLQELITKPAEPVFVQYPDCRKITISC